MNDKKVSQPSSRQPWSRALYRDESHNGNATMLCLLESADSSGTYILPCIASDGATPPPYSLRHLVLLLGYSCPPNSVADAWMLYWQTPERPCLSIHNDIMVLMRPYPEYTPGTISIHDPLWYMHNDDEIGFTAINPKVPVPINLFSHFTDTGCIGSLMDDKQSRGTTGHYSFKIKIIELTKAENVDKLRQILKNKNENEGLDLSGPYNNSDGSWSPGVNGLIDFSGLDLSDCDFSNSILRYVKFSKCNLKRAKFNNAKFVEGTDNYLIDFSGAKFRHIDFSGCDLTTINLDSNVSLSKAKAVLSRATVPFRLIKDSPWDGLDFSYATLLDIPQQISSQDVPLSAKNANLQGIFKDTPGLNLSYADFTGANLQDNDLAGADLTGATLDDCNLHGVNLQGAKLVRVSMKGAMLDTSDSDKVHTNFQNALLQDVDLGEGHLRNVLMSGAQFYGVYNKANGIDLTNADLSSANLSQIDLSATNLNTGARLEKVNLDSANLIGAKLNFANLANATFHAAYLQGADFTGAVLTAVNLDYSSVCLADTDSTVLGVPLFNIDSSTELIQSLDSGDIEGAGLQTIFKKKGQDWQSLGPPTYTPTLTPAIKGSRWILEAAAEIYKQVQKSKMMPPSGYLSYALALRGGKVFVLGRDFWCTATVVSTGGSAQTLQKTVYLKGSTPPQGVTPGAYDIKNIGATMLPATLEGGIYCPNGQTVAQNTKAGSDEWIWMMAPAPPAPPTCVPDPPHNHYCPT